MKVFAPIAVAAVIGASLATPGQSREFNNSKEYNEANNDNIRKMNAAVSSGNTVAMCRYSKRGYDLAAQNTWIGSQSNIPKATRDTYHFNVKNFKDNLAICRKHGIRFTTATTTATKRQKNKNPIEDYNTFYNTLCDELAPEVRANAKFALGIDCSKSGLAIQGTPDYMKKRLADPRNTACIERGYTGWDGGKCYSNRAEWVGGTTFNGPKPKGGY